MSPPAEWPYTRTFAERFCSLMMDRECSSSVS
ncbi:Uncharacterised protein [Mycobacterium tuberculosis]|nr:Uncharacterised protein [Mycobacterium tuberculosis]